MAAHRFFPLLSAVAAALLTGCVTVTDAPRRPKVIDAEPATAASAAPASTDDPLPPGLSPKFVAFITHQGLAHTPAQLGQPARLTAAWNNKIVYAPDPTHGGDPVPGLMARIYV